MSNFVLEGTSERLAMGLARLLQFCATFVSPFHFGSKESLFSPFHHLGLKMRKNASTRLDPSPIRDEIHS